MIALAIAVIWHADVFFPSRVLDRILAVRFLPVIKCCYGYRKSTLGFHPEEVHLFD